METPEVILEASAPCRIDMGGTLDIPGFCLLLRDEKPLTVNMAIDLRTRVRIQPFRPGCIRIRAAGIRTAEFDSERAPFHHPLGLMAAIIAYFKVDAVDVAIDSDAPPLSGLGGSSVAAVALTLGLSRCAGGNGSFPVTPDEAAEIARAVEAAVAGVPCGSQDHLAAAFGGVNAYAWAGERHRPGAYERIPLVKGKAALETLGARMRLAYTGVSHVSGDINARWVRQFMAGDFRREWKEIALLTRRFAEALSQGDLREAGNLMNREVAIRLEMTPGVLDAMGMALFQAAVRCGCGARFTGAGAGGCLWALGEPDPIERLTRRWEEVLSTRETARLVPFSLTDRGVEAERVPAADR